MSKQFRTYLIASDTEDLLNQLWNHLDFKIFEEGSTTASPVEVSFPLKQTSRRYYLASGADADIKLHYFANQTTWLIDISSEVIELDISTLGDDTLRQVGFISKLTR